VKFINFLSIQLQIAENPKIKYIHRLTNSRVLNNVIICPNHIGFHLILLCITPKIHAHAKKEISIPFILGLELASRYTIGIAVHSKADTTIHRFCPDESIQK
jgi:hypothetical protein